MENFKNHLYVIEEELHEIRGDFGKILGTSSS